MRPWRLVTSAARALGQRLTLSSRSPRSPGPQLDAEESDPTPTRLPSRYVIKRMRDMDPDRVEILVDTWDQLAGVRMENVTLTPERVLHVVHEGEFGNLRGASVLDRAFPHWYD